MKVQYEVDGCGPYVAEVPYHSAESEIDRQCIAEMCADDYFRRHDGGDGQWPMVFDIAFQAGGNPQRYFVELALMQLPSFLAKHA